MAFVQNNPDGRVNGACLSSTALPRVRGGPPCSAQLNKAVVRKNRGKPHASMKPSPVSPLPFNDHAGARYTVSRYAVLHECLCFYLGGVRRPREVNAPRCSATRDQHNTHTHTEAPLSFACLCPRRECVCGRSDIFGAESDVRWRKQENKRQASPACIIPFDYRFSSPFQARYEMVYCIHPSRHYFP